MQPVAVQNSERKLAEHLLTVDCWRLVLGDFNDLQNLKNIRRVSRFFLPIIAEISQRLISDPKCLIPRKHLLNKFTLVNGRQFLSTPVRKGIGQQSLKASACNNDYILTVSESKTCTTKEKKKNFGNVEVHDINTLNLVSNFTIPFPSEAFSLQISMGDKNVVFKFENYKDKVDFLIYEFKSGDEIRRIRDCKNKAEYFLHKNKIIIYQPSNNLIDIHNLVSKTSKVLRYQLPNMNQFYPPVRSEYLFTVSGMLNLEDYSFIHYPITASLKRLFNVSTIVELATGEKIFRFRCDSAKPFEQWNKVSYGNGTAPVFRLPQDLREYGEMQMPPSIQGDIVFYATDNGYVHAFNLKNRSFVRTMEPPGASGVSHLLTTQRWVITVTNGYGIMAWDFQPAADVSKKVIGSPR